jgi:hypothetical protein
LGGGIPYAENMVKTIFSGSPKAIALSWAINGKPPIFRFYPVALAFSLVKTTVSLIIFNKSCIRIT